MLSQCSLTVSGSVQEMSTAKRGLGNKWPHLSQALAAGTVMGGAGADLLAEDPSAAARAWFSLAVVGQQVLLEVAGPAVDTGVAVNRGAHHADSELEQALDVAVELDQFIARE